MHFATGGNKDPDCEHMPEEILPHPADEQVRKQAGDAPHNLKQRELFDHLESLARTAIPGPLLHLDPLRPIQFE